MWFRSVFPDVSDSRIDGMTSSLSRPRASVDVEDLTMALNFAADEIASLKAALDAAHTQVMRCDNPARRS